MRAVNLIPGEAGRGAGGGSGPWIVIGVLGLLLAGVVGYVLMNNTLVSRRAELASLETQVQVMQAQAEATRPYREFAALAQARVQTIRQLGAARFDWHQAFGDLARVIPGDVWLSSLLGTVTTGVSVDGVGSGSTGAMRDALPNPAIEMTGCTTSQDEVARLIARLRLMTGVVRVALADSRTNGSAGGGDDCRYGHAGYPQFGIVVFFEPLPSVPSPTQPGAAGGTPAGSTAPAGSATSAAQTTPAPVGGGSTSGSDVR